MHVGSHKFTLRDMGENSIVKELIAPRFSFSAPGALGIGDDCALLLPPNADEFLVATTDPCPTPVQCLVAATDYLHYGRMVALINVSDLAAMGAKPIGLLVSTVMPETMPVNDYERFLDGLAQASREWSCPVVGGNIKDGPDFTATGTALGSVGKDRAMRRIGARPGDRLLVVGEMGIFWAAVLRRLLPSVQFDARDDALCDEALFRPVARIREGMMLAQTRHASACMDSSDGVIGCLHELAHVNGMDILIRSDAIRPRQCIQQVADQARIDARKLMLSWGGWELVCTAAPAGVRVIQDAMKSLGTPCREIGEVRLGDGSVWIHDEGGVRRLTNFASVRFAGTSFFTHGLESYIDFLRNCPLTLS